jgi:hypothetical protein
VHRLRRSKVHPKRFYSSSGPAHANISDRIKRNLHQDYRIHPMSQAHTAQDSFDVLQLAAARPGVVSSDSDTRCIATKGIEVIEKEPRYAEHQELHSADVEIQKLFKLLSIEDRKKGSVACNRTRQPTQNSAGFLPPPMKFCRKTKSQVPVR